MTNFLLMFFPFFVECSPQRETRRHLSQITLTWAMDGFGFKRHTESWLFTPHLSRKTTTKIVAKTSLGFFNDATILLLPRNPCNNLYLVFVLRFSSRFQSGETTPTNTGSTGSSLPGGAALAMFCFKWSWCEYRRRWWWWFGWKKSYNKTPKVGGIFFPPGFFQFKQNHLLFFLRLVGTLQPMDFLPPLHHESDAQPISPWIRKILRLEVSKKNDTSIQMGGDFSKTSLCFLEQFLATSKSEALVVFRTFWSWVFDVFWRFNIPNQHFLVKIKFGNETWHDNLWTVFCWTTSI